MNVTYLMGAGASYNALPVVSEISASLARFQDSINSYTIYEAAQFKEDAKRLELDIQWLIDETEKHQTVDTFARKLFSQSKYHADLRKLKRVLNIYFLFEQTDRNRTLGLSELDEWEDGHWRTKQIPDKRYDSLLASLISLEIDNPSFKGDVKILTWNYDLQIELAYKNFVSDRLVKDIQREIQSIPGDWITDLSNFDVSRFAVVRLNGVAGIDHYLNNSQRITFLDRFSSPINNKMDFLESLVGHYRYISDDSSNEGNPSQMDRHLNFAWEALAEHDQRSPFSELGLAAAKKIAEQTQILVVIGYSFPIFNREIDKQIIDCMSKLKKVYVQDVNPVPITSLMHGAFKVLQGDDFPIQEETNTSYFLLPYEL